MVVIAYLLSQKASSLTHIDVSFNKLGARFLGNLLESFSNTQVESINLSNSLFPAHRFLTSCNTARMEERKEYMFDSMIKFLPFGLTTVSLRNLNFKQHQINDLIR